MPTYQDRFGTRYWFEEVPNPDEVRADLVLVADDEPVVDAPVPPVLTRRQAFIGLELRGMLDAVEMFVATQPRLVQLTWQTSRDFERDNEMLNAAAPLLGLDLDEFFRFASTL